MWTERSNFALSLSSTDWFTYIKWKHFKSNIYIQINIPAKLEPNFYMTLFSSNTKCALKEFLSHRDSL